MGWLIDKLVKAEENLKSGILPEIDNDNEEEIEFEEEE